jgi:two-component system sensor histidine kinase DesK
MSIAVPRWLYPANDSLLAHAMRRGRPVWSEMVHICWTLWVFIVPMFSPSGWDLRWAVLTLVSYPLFIALYVAIQIRPMAHVGAYALAMCALSLVLLPWYPSGMSYFVFGCVFLGSRRWNSMLTYVLVLAVLNALMLGVGRWAGFGWSAVAWLPLTTVITSLLIHADRAGQRKDAALLQSQEQVRRLAAMAERERIGRDLHDLLGHTLSLVALKADLAGKLLQRDPAAASREIQELGNVAREALAQVRHAVTGIRAAGLAAEVAAAQVLLEVDGTGLETRLDYLPLSAEQETALALCLREAATNIQRHAGAREVRVWLEDDGQRWVLGVEDDGRGGAIRPGNGLNGMRERLLALGGDLQIRPGSRGRGTCLLARLPHLAPPAGPARGEGLGPGAAAVR